MNPNLVEEVARAIYLHVDAAHFDTHERAMDAAQAAIRVCMARAAEIAISNRAPGAFIDYDEACTDIASDIKREGGLT